MSNCSMHGQESDYDIVILSMMLIEESFSLHTFSNLEQKKKEQTS